MSFDIMVIDRHHRIKNCKEFLTWYDDVIQWKDEADYNDYRHATESVQQWFMEMKDVAKPMNGDFAPTGNELGEGDHPEADYCIGKDFVYVALGWTDAGSTCQKAFELAKKHGLAFFDISGTSEFYFPDGRHFQVSRQQALNDAYTEDCNKEFKKRNNITMYVVSVLSLLLLVCFFSRESWGYYVGIPTLIVLILFAIWSYRWMENINKDVLKRYQQPKDNYLSKDDYIFQPEVKPLLAGVVWNFRLGQFDSQETFHDAVVKYNDEVHGRSVEEQLNTKLECVGRETTFKLFGDFSEEAETIQTNEVHLACDDGQSFSGVEILYKLNCELYPLLDNSDSTFFEGFHCYSLEGGPTICRLLLGS